MHSSKGYIPLIAVFCLFIHLIGGLAKIGNGGPLWLHAKINTRGTDFGWGPEILGAASYQKPTCAKVNRNSKKNFSISNWKQCKWRIIYAVMQISEQKNGLTLYNYIIIK